MIKDLGQKECIEFLQRNYIGRLAYIGGKIPFVIPITYYYNHKNHSIISYSLLGHKIRAMRKNSYISLQVDEIESADNWKSVLAHGEFEEL